MYKRQTSKGQSSTNHDAPANQFAPRRFVIQPQTEEAEQKPADLQAKSQTTPVNNLANIPIFPPGYQPPPPPRIQMKLSIGEPGDKYEQEADKLAQDVVQQINSSETPPLQAQSQPEAEIRKKSFIQRLSNINEKSATPDLEASIQRMQGSGQPLAETIKEPMEQAFGADFSGVKIHTDAQSDQMNQSIQAKAFTTGQDIFFRQGNYEPGSRGGQELIAHELTHVVQQTGSGKVQKLEDREIVSVGRAEKQIQRITVQEENEFKKKYKNGWKLIQLGLNRIAKAKGNEYEEYRESISKEEFEQACKQFTADAHFKDETIKNKLAQDIVVPQSYYHVTKNFAEISGLVTTGAGPCTALAMSANNQAGEIVYALTHIDADNNITQLIDNMITDMGQEIGGVIGSINAYIASSSVSADGQLSNTPKIVVPYLKTKGNVIIHFTSEKQQIRIGAEANAEKSNFVKTSDVIDQLHSGTGKKNLDGLIQQIIALPKMKGGHDWDKLEENQEYESGKHDPMEESIKQVLERALQLQEETKNDANQQEKFQPLKNAVKKEKDWYSQYVFGRKLLIWAGNDN
ncbi:DUF4157 domain-containing protein [Nostoc sp. FACHB-190]|uniref:eCIS core domain-containing protein n=1 Tax=Nostoc sp. FACHB-190 TaxID=2692838 RepID=UPI0016884B62|nr:DUF4157 domain-containing protein [Nostoc sp. FACHB-190]MBD2299769.1 DUF4157 domain-containing protein [Nostoc sp. FACHB-190]